MPRKIISTLFEHPGLGVFFIRITLGIMMVYHGFPKIPSFFDFLDSVEKMRFMYPQILGTAAVLSECVGGIFLVIGFHSRVAAFFITITMSNAFFFVHRYDQFAKKELALVYMMMALGILFAGAGKMSVHRDS